LTQTSETPDPQRLQRHVRALSAVNRQLHAQLDGGRIALDRGLKRVAASVYEL
jgi:hypothetical protein